MPKIRELELETDEDRSAVLEFARENARYFSTKGAEIITLINAKEFDYALQVMAVMITEAYTSGMADAVEEMKMTDKP